MDKHLALLRESNTVAISYTITNQGEEAGLSITPLMNFREHSASSAVSDLQFTCEPNTVGGFTLIPAAAPGLCIELSCSAGRLFHVKPIRRGYAVPDGSRQRNGGTGYTFLPI